MPVRFKDLNRFEEGCNPPNVRGLQGHERANNEKLLSPLQDLSAVADNQKCTIFCLLRSANGLAPSRGGS